MCADTDVRRKWLGFVALCVLHCSGHGRSWHLVWADRSCQLARRICWTYASARHLCMEKHSERSNKDQATEAELVREG